MSLCLVPSIFACASDAWTKGEAGNDFHLLNINVHSLSVLKGIDFSSGNMSCLFPFAASANGRLESRELRAGAAVALGLTPTCLRLK